MWLEIYNLKKSWYILVQKGIRNRIFLVFLKVLSIDMFEMILSEGPFNFYFLVAKRTHIYENY